MTYNGIPDTAPEWGTATGSTILSSLDIDTIAWQADNTIRYTFNGTPNLSSVTTGHDLVVTGSGNASNDGTFRITAVNDGSDYVEVFNPSRTSNSDDEASDAPGTANIKANAARIVEPSSAKQQQGWRSPEKPSDGIWNWFQNIVYQWTYALLQNWDGGFLLGERLTADTGISLANNTLVSSLVVTDAEYQSTTSELGRTFGLIRYSFSGSPNLSAASAGDRIVVSGCSNGTNNGTFVINAVNDGSDYIDAYNPDRTDATDDETSITAAASVHDGTKLINTGPAVGQYHKFTAADDTFEVVTGLAANNLVSIQIDARQMTAGQIDVFVDGTTEGYAVASISTAEVDEVAAETVWSDIREMERALLMPSFIVDAASEVTVTTIDSVDHVSTAGSQQTGSAGVVSAKTTSPLGIYVDPSGAYLFLIDGVNNDLLRFSMGTAFTISSSFAFDTGESYNMNTQNTVMTHVQFKPDGTKFYTMGTTGNDSLYEYSCSTPWQISSGVSYVTSYDFSGTDSQGRGISISPNGRYLYFYGEANDNIYRIEMDTPWSLASITTDAAQVLAKGTGGKGVIVVPNGRQIWFLKSTPSISHEAMRIPFDLSTGYDFGGGDYSITPDTTPNSMTYAVNGSTHYCYYSGDSTNNVYRLSIGTESYAGTILAKASYGEPA